MRDPETLMAEAREILADPNLGQSPSARVLASVQAADKVLTALQLHGGIEVVPNHSLAQMWDRLTDRGVISPYMEVRQRLVAMMETKDEIDYPFSLGPTSSQASRALRTVEALLTLAHATMSPVNPCAAIVPRGQEEPSPGL